MHGVRKWEVNAMERKGESRQSGKHMGHDHEKEKQISSRGWNMGDQDAKNDLPSMACPSPEIAN